VTKKKTLSSSGEILLLTIQEHCVSFTYRVRKASALNLSTFHVVKTLKFKIWEWGVDQVFGILDLDLMERVERAKE